MKWSLASAALLLAVACAEPAEVERNRSASEPGFEILEESDSLSSLTFTGDIASLERAVELDPSDGEAHLYLGQALASLGRMAVAARHLQRTIELQPDNAAAHFRLGFALAQMDRHTEAVRYFRAGMDRQSFRDPEVHYNLALSLLEIGQTREATAHLEAVLQAEPGHAGARNRLDDLRGRLPSSYEPY